MNLRKAAAIVIPILATASALGFIVCGTPDPNATSSQGHTFGASAPSPTGAGPVYSNKGFTTIGSGTFSPFILGKEPIFPSGQIDAGTCTTIYVDPSRVIFGEGVSDDVLVAIRDLGDTTAPPGNWRLEFLGGGNGTTVVTSDGGLVGTILLANPSPLLVDASVQWVQPDAGLLAIQICAPITSYANLSVSGIHTLPQFQGTNPTLLDGGGHYVLSAYPASFIYVLAQAETFVIATTYSDMTNATGANIGPFACDPFVVSDTHLALCTLEAGTYDGGPDASLTVSVTSPTSPVPCPGCLNAVTSMIQSCSPTSGGYSGGNLITCTANIGLAAADAGSITMVGIPCGDASILSDTQFNCYTGLYDGGLPEAGAVTIQTPDNTAPLQNGYTYTTDPAPTVASIIPDKGNTGTILTVGGVFQGATTGNSSATVCGISATLSAISMTSATVTVPAGVTIATSAYCPVAITSPFGTGSLSKYWQACAGFFVNYDFSWGATVDYQGNWPTLAPQGGQTAPASVSNYAGSGELALLFDGGGNGLGMSLVTGTNAPFTASFIGDCTGTVAGGQAIFGQTEVPGALAYCTTNPQWHIGSQGKEFAVTNVVMRSPAIIESTYNGPDGSVIFNGGSPTYGPTGDAGYTSGAWTIGTLAGGTTLPLNGHVMAVQIFSNTLSPTCQANEAAYASLKAPSIP